MSTILGRDIQVGADLCVLGQLKRIHRIAVYQGVLLQNGTYPEGTRIALWRTDGCGGEAGMTILPEDRYEVINHEGSP